jgi:hypothetical protein
VPPVSLDALASIVLLRLGSDVIRVQTDRDPALVRPLVIVGRERTMKRLTDHDMPASRLADLVNVDGGIAGVALALLASAA